MRREIKVGAVAILAAMSFGVAGAGAATPQEICRDFVDNGRLDGAYTQAELEAFMRDPSVQGYCPAPAVTPQPPESGVAGASTPPSGPAQPTGVASLDDTAEAETLPFTGSELALFVLVGGALVGGGLMLRASARQR